jgi:pyridoxamine 5'-phosphate oxidase
MRRCVPRDTPSRTLTQDRQDGAVVEDLAALRRDYGEVPFTEADLAPTWWAQFEVWFAEAKSLSEPNAMIVATATAAGRPSARTVLLKGYDERGFVFFTNYRSRKATELAGNPYASLVFPWHAIGRQVVVCGAVTRVERAETETYFATRPRESQLGAWASPQSEVIPDRAALDRRWAEVQDRFPGEIDPPAHWGGLRVAPDTVEFWHGRTGRLHDRLRYRHTSTGWVTERLAP